MAKHKPEHKRLLPNYRFLIATGLPFVVLAAVAVAWYAFQDRRLESALLERAAELEEQGEFAKAAEYLYQYLQKNPENTQIAVQLAETYDKGIGSTQTTDRAIRLYDQALSVADDEETPRLRARRAELLLARRRFTDAGKQAEELLKNDPESAAGLKWFALALIAQYETGTRVVEDLRASIKETCAPIPGLGDVSAMSGLFEAALERNPYDPELSGALARILRAPSRPKDVAGDLLDEAWLAKPPQERDIEADRRMDDVVAHWDDDPERKEDPLGGLLLRYDYLRQFNRGQDATADLEKAEQLAGDDPRVLIRLAGEAYERHLASSRQRSEAASQKALAEGAAYCERILKESPTNVSAAELLGRIRLAEGDWEAAVRTWEACLNRQGENANPALAHSVASTLIEHAPRSEETAKAVARFRDLLGRDLLERMRGSGQTARQAQQSQTERDLLTAAYHAARGKFDEAIDLYVRIDRLAESGDLTPPQRERLRIGLGDAYMGRIASGGSEGTAGTVSEAASVQQAYAQAAQSYDALARDTDLAIRSKAASILAANAWLKAGKPEESLERLSKAIEGFYRPGERMGERLETLEKTLRERREELGETAERFDVLIGFLGAQVRLAEGEADEGETAEAIGAVESLVRQTDVKVPPRLLFELAQLQARRERAKPEAKRDWSTVEATLNRLKQSDLTGWNDSYRVVLLEVEVLSRGKPLADASEETKKAVVDRLRQAEEDYSDNAVALREFAIVYEILADREEANRLVALAKARADNRAFTALVDAQLAASRGGPEAGRKVLQDALEDADEQTAQVLRTQIRIIDMLAGDRDAARKALLEMHEQAPRQVQPVVQLLEFALRDGDFAEMESWETELREIEGEDGFFWCYYRAQRLLRDEGETATQSLDEAFELFAKIETVRLEWAPLQLLAVRLHARRAALHLEEGRRLEQSGDTAGAETAYENTARDAEAGLRYYAKAVEFGGENPLLQAATVRLLMQARAGTLGILLDEDRMSEIEPLVTALNEALPKPEGDREEMEGESGEGERALLLALFRQTLETRGTDEARRFLQAVARFDGIQTLDRQLLLGEAYELLGEPDEAEKHFRAAAEAGEGAAKSAAQRRLAVFLATRGTTAGAKEAEQFLNRVLARDPDDYRSKMGLLELYLSQGRREEARRILDSLETVTKLREFVKARAFMNAYARLGDEEKASEYREAALKAAEGPDDQLEVVSTLLNRGDAESLTAAEALLESAREADPQSLPVRRTLAQVLLRQGPERAAEAKALLRELAAREEPGAMVDCLAVAEILESEGEMESARQMYGQAVTVSESRPAALGALAEFLLRREKAEEALLLAEQLEQSSPSPRAFSLKLACWNALERSDEIDQALQDRETTLLEDAGEDPRRRAAALVSLGADCMGIGRFEQAEALFRRAVELDPAAKSALSAALSAQKKSGEALSSAIDLFNTRSTQAAAMAVFQVISGMPVDELKASPDVDPFLAKAVESFPNDVRLLLEAAATRIRQDRGDDAIALYEKVLTIAPNQPATLNNLAALLTYKPQRQEEALKHVDKALALFGNRAIPAVLDTKGTILLAMGRNDQALQWLEKAIAPEEADPVHLLHAAVAYLRTGERGRAEESFKLAQERGLAEAELQKHDIDLKSELEEALQ